MTTAVAGVRWSEALLPYTCGECYADIMPGECMAAWREVFITISGFGIEAKHGRRDRIYCADCGELLEDSLTTTGDRRQAAAIKLKSVI